jgi:hypothetical protein
MILAVYTAHSSYPGPDRLDISPASGCYQFAPIGLCHDSWPEYVERYTESMRNSYRTNRPFWDLVLASKRIVLTCHCQDPSVCHRAVLAKILWQVGAKTKRPVSLYGEITEWDSTVEEPLFLRSR